MNLSVLPFLVSLKSAKSYLVTEKDTRHGPKAGFNFTLEGTLLLGVGFEPTSSHGH